MSPSNGKVVYVAGGSDSELGVGTWAREAIPGLSFVRSHHPRIHSLNQSPTHTRPVFTTAAQTSRLSSSYHVRGDSRWSGLSRVPGLGAAMHALRSMTLADVLYGATVSGAVYQLHAAALMAGQSALEEGDTGLAAADD